MPLYDYKCTKCGTIREVRHGFHESHEEPCPACGAAMTRVFSAAPIVFKGSGFYVTDSKPAAATKSEPKSEPKTDAKTETKSETKSEAPASPSPKSESAA